jgi:hypothetical protein
VSIRKHTCTYARPPVLIEGYIRNPRKGVHKQPSFTRVKEWIIEEKGVPSMLRNKLTVATVSILIATIEIAWVLWMLL